MLPLGSFLEIEIISLPRETKCASLPPDVWRHVASFLPKSDLVNLALVSQTCRAAALSPDLFAKHLSIQPPADLLSTTSYPTIYRNSHSLRLTPLISKVFSPDVRKAKLAILGSVSKLLIMYDENTGMVSTYPNEWRRDISELISKTAAENNENEEMSDSSSPKDESKPFQRQFVSERFLELPNCEIGFLSDAKNGIRKTFVTVNAETGQTVRTMFLPTNVGDELGRLAFGMDKPRRILLGGNESQYMVYFVGRMLFVIRRDEGTLVKKWPNAEESMLVRGETSFNAPLITGVVRCDGFEDRKQYHIHTLEGGSSDYHFCIDQHDTLIDVAQSRDGNTISKRVSSAKKVKLWTVVHHDIIFHWYQKLPLSNRTGALEMRSNGSQILIRPEGGGGRIVRINYGLPVRVEQLARRVQSSAFDWARASWDGRIVLAVSRSSGFLSIFDCDEGRCLKSVSIGDQIDDLVLVDGHILVALTPGHIVECHFKRFCGCEGLFGERQQAAENDSTTSPAEASAEAG
ncbi:hypothetical protein BWQ96_08737 [Gracilariopsis chorda]|uniref:F-box domain-containing protein n=1 Tax=Gracilariopsis chorda TaxID=448386 RepID=A0A2V3IHG5_9FLOR|nr:hypothetical protein BWQ96_08737 [Gracilariopsis chorda]|eukprot:PXF41534.1 hypothetical protein BWQ96_08737 [Gracilariopsis chorda]